MLRFKSFLFYLIIITSTLTVSTYSETLNFKFGTYEGETKKDKAHGQGVFTFNDGSTYEGTFKRNAFHGQGKFTDSNGEEFEGKFRGGKLRIKVDKNTRKTIALKVNREPKNIFEMKGTGATFNKWFEAEYNSSGEIVLTKKGQQAKLQAERGAAGSDSGGGGGGGGC